MKRNIIYTSIISTVCAIFLQQCNYDTRDDLYPLSEEDTSKVVSFKEDIQPFITATCATSPSCHASGSNNPQFINYENIANRAPLIKTRAVDLKEMPPSGGANQAGLDKLEKWIEAGAPNN